MFASTSMTTVTVASPNQTLRRHTDQVRGVVHLPAGQQYITCSLDGSVQLWDPEKGACTWQDSAVYDTEVWSMALSPNGKTVVSGGNKGILRLWNVKRGKVFSRWAGHDHVVGALCWSGNGKQVLSGSWDGTARVWNVKTGKTVLTIETGHKHVFAVIFSPDATKIV